MDALHEDSWSLVRNHLLKELAQSDEYMHLLGGIDRYKELKRSLLISMVYKFFVTYSWIKFM